MIKKAHKTELLSTHPAPAIVVITDMDDYDEEYTCRGSYYGTGRLLVDYKGRQLAINPKVLHPKDPKRLFIVKSGDWSRFRVRSIILDSKAIVKGYQKTGISTRLQPA